MRSDGTLEPTDNKSIDVFDRPGGKRTTPEKGTGGYQGIAQSPGGRSLAAFAPLFDTVFIWDAASGKVTHVFKDTLGVSKKGAAGGKGIQCLAFRSEGELDFVDGAKLQRVRLGREGVETVRRVAVRRVQPTLDNVHVPDDAVMALAYSADGRRAALGTARRVVVVYETETWKELLRLSGHTRGVTGVAFAPDGRRLASCSGRYFRASVVEANDNPGEVIVWDTATWQDVLTLTRTEPSEFAGVGFGDGGRTLYAAANRVVTGPGKVPHGEVVRWVTRAGSAPAVPRPAPAPSEASAGTGVYRAGLFVARGGLVGLQSVAVHPTGELIAASIVIDRVLLWDVRTREVIAEADLPKIGLPGWRLRFTPDGAILICEGNRVSPVSVRSVPSLKEVKAQKEELSLEPLSPRDEDRGPNRQRTFPLQGREQGNSSPLSRDGEDPRPGQGGASPSSRSCRSRPRPRRARSPQRRAPRVRRHRQWQSRLCRDPAEGRERRHTLGSDISAPGSSLRGVARGRAGHQEPGRGVARLELLGSEG